MCQKMTTRTVFTLTVIAMAILGLTIPSARAGLLAYYPFDSDFTDASGNNNDLTIATGTPTITNTSGEYVFGGGALDADSTVSTEEYLNLTSSIKFEAEDAWSIAFWARRRPGTDYRTGMVIGDPSNKTDFIWIPDNPSQVQGLRFRSSANMNANFGAFPDDQEFHHWVVIADGAGNVSAYRDNVSQGSVAMTSDFSITSVAGAYSATTQSMDGQIDELCIYNEAIDASTVGNLYNGETPFIDTTKSSNPSPEDGAVYENTWATLMWNPGEFAVSHDVYVGESFDDVNNATHDSPTFLGNETVTLLMIGLPGFAYPDGLVPGTTYYWRIDEVNEVNPESPWKGNVWSFSIPPQTAYDPDPADGNELTDPNNAILSWTPGYGAIMHTVYLGDDFDEVSNAVGGESIGDATYDTGALEREKIYYWRVDEFDGVVTYTGIVWTFTTTGAVGNPQPANGAIDVEVATILSWTPADNAASHEIYLGLEKDSVRSADTSSSEYKGSKALGDESFDPGILEPETTYYWRVDEVYDGIPVKGPVWSFTVGS